MKIFKKASVLFFYALFFTRLGNAQVLQESGSLMKWVQVHVSEELPAENTEAFEVPDSVALERWRRIMDALLDNSFDSVSDSLDAHFPGYQIVDFTDTLFSDLTYYMIREEAPVSYGWGTFIYFPQWQRDMTVAAPHPLNDENTPFEALDLFQYTGARLYVLAGTHRCSNAAPSSCDGTTGVCNNGVQQAFRVSDMAHTEISPFQIVHEVMFDLSPNAWFFNIHGHNDNDCADFFLSAGRGDDVTSSLQALKDSLVAHGLDAKHTGDGTACPLTGGTNTQGRLVNGSEDPCGDANDSNSGRFFHIEQSPEVRREQQKYKVLVEEIADLVPRSFNTVSLPAFPDIVLNEFLPHPRTPHGDANGDGVKNTNTDEFIELVNNSTYTVDLSGWTIADFRKDRHTFANGTTLLRGQALVLFGPAVPVGSFGNAVVTYASDSLSLANTNDTIELKNAGGATVWKYSYANSDTSISRARSPEVTGAFTSHLTASGSVRFSPGTKIDGSPFLSNATIITTAGWRMLSAPVPDFSINELKQQTPIQGFGDGFDKNFYTGYNGSAWTAPGDLTGTLVPGSGFILYFFNNNLAGSSTLPVTLSTPGTAHDYDVEISLHTSGDKFNLLGNPFAQSFDFTELVANGGTLASSVGQVWNPQTRMYVTTTALGDKLTAWQGVMVENSSATSVTFPFSGTSSGGTFHGKSKTIEKTQLLAFETGTEPGKPTDLIYLAISDQNGGALMARKLPPLSEQKFSVAFVSNGAFFHQLGHLSAEAKSYPLIFSGSQPEGWIRLAPAADVSSWRVELVDLSTGRSNILSADPVSIEADKPFFPAANSKPFLSRYEIRVSPVSVTAQPPESTEKTVLFSPHPNPFNGEATLQFSLINAGSVRLEILDISGRRSLLLANGTYSAGRHYVRFNAGNMASGVYLVVLTASGERIVKRFVLLR